MLAASERPLVAAYNLVMLDLDGVVYVGDEAVPGAPAHLARARDEGAHLAFITNNASRPPEAVAEKLLRVGVQASAQDVVTSAQAAARVVRDRFGQGARVACLGAAGLDEALRAEGLEPVAVDDEGAVVLTTGYAPDAVWSDIMRAAVRVRDGLPWVASNDDLSLPTPFGLAPGHGVLVRLIEQFADVEAEVAGKPERPLLDETVRRVGGGHPLMVGDRLDTDIEGANRAGFDSLLVMTGVTDLAVLAAAAPALRPTYVAPDLAGLFTTHAAPEETEAGWTCGGWTARAANRRLVVEGDGHPADWWRVVASASWQALDAGEPVDVADVVPPGGGAGR